MKAVVFDNAGTILQRKTVINDRLNKELFFETNTIGITNQNKDNIIIVFQMPTKKLFDYADCTIYDFLKKFPNQYEIAYSQKDISKEEVLKNLDRNVYIEEILDSARKLKECNVQICSGSAIIVDTSTGNINYLYTAGGSFFPYTSETMDSLRKRGFEIFIASGDNKNSLDKISSILNIPKNNIFNTCNINCKQRVIKNLQNKGYHVVMVGNHTNDKMAIKQADIGILTREQKEEVPDYLIEEADYVIDSIKSVDMILKKEDM